MRVAIRALALAAIILTVSAASAQTTSTTSTPRSTLPTTNAARMSVSGAISNLFGIRNLLPTFRTTDPTSNGVPNSVLNGVPDTSNTANYLKGFGYQRLGK